MLALIMKGTFMHHESRQCYRGAARVGPPRGFTLIEFMVAVTIAAILVAIAGPSFVDLTATQRVKTVSFDFYSSLMFARSEAIKRNTVVNIAPRDGGFANGWDILAGATVLSSRLGIGNVAISVPEGVLAYNQDGRLTFAGRYDALLTAPGNSMVATRCVTVDPGGRPSIRIDANRDGNCFNG